MSVELPKKTMDELDFREKAWMHALGLPSRGLAVLLPTQTLHNSNLVTPENFIQFRPSIQKFFMIFFNIDTQMDGHTNSIQNESPH